MARGERVYLEVGQRWVFACAIDWPGWARRGRSEEAAVEALLDYVPRYRAVVGGGFRPGTVEIVGRVAGDMTTDFGAPRAIGPTDSEPVPAKELSRQLDLLVSCWRAFDAVVATAPAELRKGPRGGGRNTAGIVEHVREAERAYAPKVSARIPKGTPIETHRHLLLTALGDRSTAPKWPRLYGIRRVAWHALDHAWEIEDKGDPSAPSDAA